MGAGKQRKSITIMMDFRLIYIQHIHYKTAINI